ncbi:hypothetical protein [Pseudomonas brassicacearum]|uniref:hypothetical protein n=1 Tax=Pseudomonas brassicacearum TaxID=930166 RepID=UPI001BDF697B|nr:hypothetical protein [Pseudomonas brassicacearum]
MSEVSKLVLASGKKNTSEDVYRLHAVAAALEVIAARATSSTPIDLGSEFSSLSRYADQIQEALVVTAK